MFVCRSLASPLASVVVDPVGCNSRVSRILSFGCLRVLYGGGAGRMSGNCGSFLGSSGVVAGAALVTPSPFVVLDAKG